MDSWSEKKPRRASARCWKAVSRVLAWKQSVSPGDTFISAVTIG